MYVCMYVCMYVYFIISVNQTNHWKKLYYLCPAINVGQHETLI